MDNLIVGLSNLFKQAYQQGLEDGRKEATVTPELLDRKQISERVLHVAPNTADQFYLYQPGFPYMEQNGKRKYYLPAVSEWLMKNQQITE